MSLNKIHGEKGEALAANFLIKKGYTILEKNYRYKRAEIDLIVKKDNLLIFVEVKARSSQNYGFPEEAVNEKKSEMVISAANQYILAIDWHDEIRFDIIAITILEQVEILHFKDPWY